MVKERGEAYEAFMDGVVENVEALLRQYEDAVAITQLSEEYAREYDDELVGAVRPANTAEVVEQYGDLLPQVAHPPTPGPAMDRAVTAAVSASPIFFAQISEAVDRLEAEGRLERDPVGATPRVRYTGPDAGVLPEDGDA